MDLVDSPAQSADHAPSHRVATRDEWRRERVALLAEEKALTRRRDELAARRRDLPWVAVEQAYVFETEHGRRTLAELFDGRRQLVVSHFMYGREWTAGCPSCSFWADGYDGVTRHLAARDTTLVAVSRAPLDALLAYRRRLGWSFPWVSSLGTTFNEDFGVSDASVYNYAPVEQPSEESPGLSTFVLHDGVVFHTYSCYARGLDAFNIAYALLDVTPLGRQEDDLAWPMAWLRRRDEY